jgi:hypothetical protein
MRFWTVAAALLTALAGSLPAQAISHVHWHNSVKKSWKPLPKKPAKPVKGQTAPPAVVKPPHLNYYGGRVISNVKLVAVFWGPSVDPQVVSSMPTFYSDFAQSPMFDWLSEYNTNIKTVSGGAGTNQTIGRGSFLKAVTITPSKNLAKAKQVTDAQIQQELTAQLKKGALPAADANTLYMIHFPPKLVIKSGSGLSCKSFCAYHSTLGTSTYYGVIPDAGPGSGCDVGCGNLSAFENLTASCTHEIVEAVTDAQIGAVKGNTIVPPAAWYDPDKDATGHEYAEIGDICAAYEVPMAMASGKSWVVQKEWSNKHNGCIALASDPPIPVAAPTSAAAVASNKAGSDAPASVKTASAKSTGGKSKGAKPASTKKKKAP